MKTLKLVLKKQWFDMIASGEKTEEYREIKSYWQKRLCRGCKADACFNECASYLHKAMYNESEIYDKVTFYLGYKKDRPERTYQIKSISVGKGKEEWGAEKDKIYFVIKLGKRIDNL